MTPDGTTTSITEAIAVEKAAEDLPDIFQMEAGL